MPKVLVVEDNRSLASMAKAMIEDIPGFEVVVTANGTEARSRAQEDPEGFSVALVDLNLPDAPNGEIVPVLQSLSIPVIVLTGYFGEELRTKMVDLGVVDYVLKKNISAYEYVAGLVKRVHLNRNTKVLVVDDSPSVLSMLTRYLNIQCLKVITATNGAEALQRIGEHPDIKLVLSNAGHILGSATCHFHIGNGEHNFVYTGDIKYGKSMLLESANTNYPRVETLLIESTYGAKEDIQPDRQEVESAFIASVNSVLKEGGKVLIPIPAVGRAQELMLVIDQYMKSGELVEAPVFMEGMIQEATAIHEAFPEYLVRDLKKKILETDDNPFDSEYFTNITHQDGREEPLRENSPCIIIATSGMLEGGPVLEYFRNVAPHAKNKILFVSYQVNGTLGRRVMDGAKQVSILGKEGRIEVVSINCSTERLDGFSGHSDYNQLMSFVHRLRPKLRRVLVNHGERRKSENLSMSIRRMYRVSSHYPQIQEAIKLF